MFTLWVLMILGNIINIGYKINKDIKVETTNIFVFIAKWVVKPRNFMYCVLGLLTSIVLLVSVDFSTMGEFTYADITFKWSYIVATAIGFMAQVIFNALMFRVKSKIK